MKTYYITQAAYDLTWHKTKADLERYKLNGLHKRETKVFANPGVFQAYIMKDEKIVGLISRNTYQAAVTAAEEQCI